MDAHDSEQEHHGHGGDDGHGGLDRARERDERRGETTAEVSGERAHRAGVNGVARRGRYGSSRSARLRR